MKILKARRALRKKARSLAESAAKSSRGTDNPLDAKSLFRHNLKKLKAAKAAAKGKTRRAKRLKRRAEVDLKKAQKYGALEARQDARRARRAEGKNPYDIKKPTK